MTSAAHSHSNPSHDKQNIDTRKKIVLEINIFESARFENSIHTQKLINIC